MYEQDINNGHAFTKLAHTTVKLYGACYIENVPHVLQWNPVLTNARVTKYSIQRNIAHDCTNSLYTFME